MLSFAVTARERRTRATVVRSMAMKEPMRVPVFDVLRMRQPFIRSEAYLATSPNRGAALRWP
jgi:hypothetical protein